VVIVFARAPRAGEVKTRIARHIGDAAAARLHERLLNVALATAAASRCGPVELHASRRHASFGRWRLPVQVQRGADLGERMHRALRRALRRHRRVILIGADCPALTPFDIRRAARWLHGGADIVLAPAEDGGYALIAARRITPRVFDDIAWGSERVLEQTIANAQRTRLKVRLLRTVWDVDRPEDLERLRSRPLALAARRGARR
jgi:rSAM/selenodomain-associated transferase 1